MGFYQELANYYDFLFPVRENQLNFITKTAGKPPRRLLDVACGSGNYSLELARLGYDMTAVDLDMQMIETLRNKARSRQIDIKAYQVNMLDLRKTLSDRYDLIFCIGNSLAHLKDEREIVDFLNGAKGLMERSGSLILQVVNFAKVLRRKTEQFPLLSHEKEGIKFEREYTYDEASGNVIFKSILTVQDKEFVNRIILYPVLKDNLTELLLSAGFHHIQIYGDFMGNDFESEHSAALIIVAS